MLTKNSVMAASTIVEDFNKRGLVILPLPGTPMQAVCSTMAPGDAVPENIEDLVQLSAEMTMVVDVTEDQPIVDAVANVTQGEGDTLEVEVPTEPVVVGEKTVHVHDEVVATAIADMSGKLKYAMETARTVVMPQCRLLFAELEQRVGDLMYAPRLIPTVNMSYYPDWYTSDHFMSQMTGVNLSAFVEADRTMSQNQNLALIPGDYLRQALVTGNTDIDVLVAQAAEGVTDAALEDIYNHFFRGSMLSVVDEFLIGDQVGRGFADTRAAATPALFVWTWSQSLLEDIQEGNKLSLDNYQATMMRATKVALNGMARIYKQRMAQIESGELILRAPSLYQIRQAEDASDLQIFVNADTYLEYIRNGGSPEALTGAVLMEKIQMRKEDLLGYNDALMRQYNEFVELKATQQSANRIRAYALALKGLFADKVIPALGNDGENEAAELAVSQIVENMNDTDIANLQQFFRRLYVNVTVKDGAQTLNRLVDEIDIEMRANPELTVFEAATKAMVNVLGDFVAQQLYVVEA